jgi:hypothetical protein
LLERIISSAARSRLPVISGTLVKHARLFDSCCIVGFRNDRRLTLSEGESHRRSGRHPRRANVAALSPQRLYATCYLNGESRRRLGVGWERAGGVEPFGGGQALATDNGRRRETVHAPCPSRRPVASATRGCARMLAVHAERSSVRG